MEYNITGTKVTIKNVTQNFKMRLKIYLDFIDIDWPKHAESN